MKPFFMFFFILLSVALTYVGWHIWYVLPLSKGMKWSIIGLLAVCFACLFLNFGRIPDRVPLWLGSTIYNVGCSSLLILLYLFMTFLVLDLGRLVRLVPKAWLHDNGITSISILILMVGVFVYGYLHYQHKEREEVTLTSPKVVNGKKKLVMVSDLHLGYHNRRAALERWVELLNAEKADAIVEEDTLNDNLLACINVLTDREREVVSRYYGLKGWRQTMAEIAEDMGLKRERVRQERNKAVRKLRKASKEVRK